MIHYSNLPRDVIHIILNYDGRIIFKKGKYIIDTDNKIYNCIKQNIKNKIYFIRYIPKVFRKFIGVYTSFKINEEEEIKVFIFHKEDEILKKNNWTNEIIFRMNTKNKVFYGTQIHYLYS